MALRRPPTRIELKPDDIEEYDQILRERQMIAEEAANGKYGKAGESEVGVTPSPHTQRKKLSARERIGIGRPR
eukprot:CAMPEP_0195269624 /NCGR_PEP_ID=MMETSP0706-20130129/13877_1 /TAXON_ID=33640 /ORGANISM="Asterionellopsis glacialis, Strain CCMP134" /LENGTH=72 /DNA_ID=CAMNT_0040324763 /DNA_START=21 /DNA_END=239 /DNA_ORIENTATION=+